MSTGAPVTCAPGCGGPLEVPAVDELLTEFGIDEEPCDTETGDTVRSAPTEWAYTDVPCAYVVAMIDGWKTDDPSASGRHPSLQDRAVRLTAAHRRGCLTEQLHDQGRRVLAATMR